MVLENLSKSEKIALLFQIYEAKGYQAYFGESVTQWQHAAQTAELAEAAGADDAVIVAAFLHDIGHLSEDMTPENAMENLGIIDHEAAGALFLQRVGFPERVGRWVASHVAAKRYLTFAQPDYYAQLFEADPLFLPYIALRQWDEQAKDPDREWTDLTWIEGKIRAVLD